MRTTVSGITSRILSSNATVFVLLAVIFAVVFALNPGFAEPMSLMAFVKKAAPLILLAIGQYFVIVSGEFDLSVGSLVGAQVVIAALLIDGNESATLPVILLMFAGGIVVGLVNGLVTTLLKVPSIITTLGTMLVLYGAIRWLTGGAPTGSLSTAFRAAGRQGVDDVPLIGQLPWALLIVLVVGVGAVFLMRSPWGRTLIAVGDNDQAARFAGARVWWVKTAAFTLSGFLATGAGILIGGYAGVTAQVGEGMEFTAITAVVLGGVVLGGGRGWVVAAMAGALTVEALFTLFNQLSVPSTVRPAAQGLIIIAAVAYAAIDRARRARTVTETHPTPRHTDVATP
ncbi:ribose transport system permease protein [Stackebrandtia albiflava]|uniref:Ribose transport system permease protein n=1 Tax=Stackebrandtia albiflava TaxID=406432 RepID=A0A562UXS9_9ACTN|nr:ABC transporter permease [Stackebrandtia albiflava]TWJ10422.1 ribose transport system permease protein [Stackebrandtia albiflava]